MNKLEIEQEIVSIIGNITTIPKRNIRISYQQKGQPAFKQGSNYCYVSLTNFDSEYEKPVTVKFDPENEIETYQKTKGRTCNLVFVGPDSYDNANKVMTLINNNSYTKNLRKNDIYYICSTDSPRRVPTLVNNEWFEQVFLNLRFYQKLLYNIPRNRIEHVEVNILTDTGEQTSFTIENKTGGN